MKTFLHSFNLDKLGMGISSLCALHCVAIPIVLVMGLDTLLPFLENRWLETFLIVGTFLVGFVAFAKGVFLHKRYSLFVIFSVGFLLIAVSEELNSTFLSLSTSLSGVTLIVLAHAQNIQHSKRAQKAVNA